MNGTTTILTGRKATGHMIDSWREAHHGMVELDVIDPWLKVGRAGAEYACYLSLVDGTAVTVSPAWGDRDTDEDVPNDCYPGELIDDETRAMLSEAFGGERTGAYPMPDADEFWMGFRDPETGAYKRLVVGLHDGTVEIEEDE